MVRSSKIVRRQKNPGLAAASSGRKLSGDKMGLSMGSLLFLTAKKFNGGYFKSLLRDFRVISLGILGKVPLAIFPCPHSTRGFQGHHAAGSTAEVLVGELPEGRLGRGNRGVAGQGISWSPEKMGWLSTLMGAGLLL